MPSTIEWVICVLLPVVGVVLGFADLGNGRRIAGLCMLLVSASMFAFCNSPLLFVLLIGSITELAG